MIGSVLRSRQAQSSIHHRLHAVPTPQYARENMQVCRVGLRGVQ